MRRSVLASAFVLASITVVAERSFPCSPVAYGLSLSQATPWQSTDTVHVGPRPVVFGTFDSYPPQTLDRDGVEVALEFASILDIEDGHMFQVTQPLKPGTYCFQTQCMIVDAEPPAGNAAVLAGAALDGSEATKGSRSSSGCGSNDDLCGGSAATPRSVSINRSGPAAVNTAKYLVRIAPTQDAYSTTVPKLTDLYRLSATAADTTFAFDEAEQICVQVSAVTWDGEISTPEDLGCVGFAPR